MGMFDDIGALVSAHSMRLESALDRAGLNPQPLPPKDLVAFSTPGEEVGLNPQPLPPAAMLTVLKDFDTVASDPNQSPPPMDAASFVDAIAGVLESATAAPKPVLAIFEGIEVVEPWSDELGTSRDEAFDRPMPTFSEPSAFETFAPVEVTTVSTDA